MNKGSCLALIGLFIMIVGCTKDYNLNLPDTKPLYVIEGRISNMEGPYFIRITKSSNELALHTIDPLAFGFDSAQPVKNALVIISDEGGITDTLIPSPYQHRRLIYLYDNTNHKFDSFPQQILPFYTIDHGYYQTTKIRGVAGHTYHLQVFDGNEKFEATAYMPPVPVLDSAVLRDTIVGPEHERIYMPLAYFAEPQNEKNYYGLSFNLITDYPFDFFVFGSGSSGLPYVVDDKVLTPYVNGLAIQTLLSKHYPFSPYYPYEHVSLLPPHPFQIRLFSLTKETYNYFDQQNRQLGDDGNIYRPTPASAKGNISGGALGQFYATDISYKLILP